ncbi:MAG: radical SAM protein, partial [Anaerolineae bacterium]|nr:radical SAM protein [Anaerolineae bacterium]
SYYWPPIDLIMLSGFLAQHYEVRVIDAIINHIPHNRCLEEITEWHPDVVIFLTGITSWPADMEFTRQIKERTDALILGIGGNLLYESESYLKAYPHLDAVILDFTAGDDVIDFIEGAGDGETELPNLTYSRNGKIVPGRRQEEGPTFTVPVPRHELFDLSRYRLPHGRHRPLTSVMVSDGCPYSCAFCVASPLRYRYRPLDNVMAEFEHLASIGVRELFFKDFTFGVRKDLTIQMCDEMVRNKFDFSWIASCRVDTVDRELLEAMKRAGCHTIQFGVESADEELLKQYRKKITQDQTRQTFELCREVGIRTLAHFILGLPGETRESIMRTVQYAKSLRCDYASFNVVIPQVGTDLRRMAIEKGYYRPDVQTFDSGRAFPVVETEKLTKDELWHYRNRAIRSFYLDPRYIWRRATGVRTWTEFRNLVENGVALLMGANPVILEG